MTSLILGIFVIAFALTNTGCTPKISDEQLLKLRELKEQAARLESDIKKLKNQLLRKRFPLVKLKQSSLSRIKSSFNRNFKHGRIHGLTLFLLQPRVS
jgi:hypothetical protein